MPPLTPGAGTDQSPADSLSVGSAVLSGTLPPVDSERLSLYARSLKSVRLSFRRLHGITPEELAGDPPVDPKKARLFGMLKELIQIDQSSMKEMNEAHPGLPIDSTARIIDLVTRPGARLSILKGIIPGENNDQPVVLGFGIVIKGRDNFLDEVPHIDPQLLEDPKCSRVIRLFITKAGRTFLARGEAFNRIYDDVKKIGGQHPVYGMMLEDVIQAEGTFPSNLNKRPWLEALAAAVSRGAVPHGDSFTEIIHHSNGQVVGLPFRYYSFNSAAGESQIAATRARYAATERKGQEQTAWMAPVIPYSDEHVLMWARPNYFYNAAYLWERVKFIGADLPDGEKVSNRESRPNLEVRAGNARGLLFAPESVGAIAVLGALPFVTHGDPGEAVGQIHEFLRNQVRQLKPGGLLVVRNPVKLDLPRQIFAKLSTGSVDGAPSVAQKFDAFCSSQTKEPGIPAAEWQQRFTLDSYSGWERRLVPSEIVREFALKYFQKDIDQMRGRLFAPDTRAERLAAFDGQNVRLLYDGPEFNHWIQESHLTDKIRLAKIGGSEIALPTNHVTYLEKVRPGEGVKIELVSSQMAPSTEFVSVRAYQGSDPATGNSITREVADRKNVTHTLKIFAIDTRANGDQRLLLQVRVYPRPLATTCSYIDGSKVGGYFTEQVAAIVTPETFENRTAMEQSAKRILAGRAGIDPGQVKEISAPVSYLPDGDQISERVMSQAVEIAAPRGTHFVDSNLSGFNTKVQLKMVDGVQLLQQCQVGSHMDSRSEAAVYELSLLKGLSVGPWIGARPNLPLRTIPGFKPSSIEEVLNPKGRAIFSELPPETKLGHLAKWEGTFIVRDGAGKEVGRAERLEWIVPGEKTDFTPNRIPVVPVMNVARPGQLPEIYIGIEMRDLPAAQQHTGSSLIASLPTFTATKDVDTPIEADSYARTRLKAQFGIVADSLSALGGKYFTSLGISPTNMNPVIAVVNPEQSNLGSLSWVPLRELPAHASRILDGQLNILQYRAAHALGLLDT